MLPEVSVAIVVSRENVEFRFAAPISIFILVVSRDHEVVWELKAASGQQEERTQGVGFVVPLELATPQMLTMVGQAEQAFMARVHDGPPLTTPVSLVRYGQVPVGYREEASAQKLAPGRYDLMAVCAQGHVSSEFDVPAA